MRLLENKNQVYTYFEVNTLNTKLMVWGQKLKIISVLYKRILIICYCNMYFCYKFSGSQNAFLVTESRYEFM